MTKKFLTPLLLPADPANPLEAATKQYVDAQAGGGGTKITDLSPMYGYDLESGDIIEVVDTNDTTMAISGTNKRTTLADLGDFLVANGVGGIDQATADTRYVNVTGDTMTGGLTTSSLLAGPSGSIHTEILPGMVHVNDGVGGYSGLGLNLFGGDITLGHATSRVLLNNLTPTDLSAVTPKQYVDDADALRVPKTTTITANAPLSGGGDLSSSRSLSIAAANTTTVGVSRLATTAEATAQSLATVAVTPAGLADRVLTSRTVSTTAPLAGGGALSGNLTLTLNDDGVTNAKLADMVTLTLKGNNTGVTANPLDLTVAQVKTMLALDQVTNTTDANKPVSTAQATAIGLKADKTITFTPTAPLTGGGDLSANRTLAVSTFTSGAAGVVPASGGVATNFLSADGTWKAVPGGTPPNDSVTNAVLANMATLTLKGNNTGGAADPLDLTVAKSRRCSPIPPPMSVLSRQQQRIQRMSMSVETR